MYIEQLKCQNALMGLISLKRCVCSAPSIRQTTSVNHRMKVSSVPVPAVTYITHDVHLTVGL